jgi:hypothetical protein
VLVLTSLSTASQVRLAASVLGPGGVRLSIFGKGSRLGPWLTPGRAPKVAQTQILTPGGVAVRLRVNGRFVAPHTRYTVRLVATDPWGRTATLLLPFRTP